MRSYWMALLCVGVGCASVPRFETSQPMALAKSLTEGLLLCNEYSMPEPALRPVFLKPFLDCFEEVEKVFDPSATHFTFHVFLTEFRKNYQLLEEVEWKPLLGGKYEIAIHAIARDLSHGSVSSVDFISAEFTPAEQELALHFFPKTAQTLNARNWKTTPLAQFDPELEKLYAAIAPLLPALGPHSLQGTAAIEPGIAQVQLEKQRKTLQELIEKVEQLQSLSKDLKIFSRISPEGPEAAIPFAQTLARYRRLLAETQETLRTPPLRVKERSLVNRQL